MTIVYAGVWLALAMLFSIVFRSAATAALVTLGLWLFLTLIWPVLAGAIARHRAAGSALRGAGQQTPGPRTRRSCRGCRPARCSARWCWRSSILDHAGARPDLSEPAAGRRHGRAAAACGESLLIAWPQIVGLVAASILLFVIGYVVFQRQEVRA